MESYSQKQSWIGVDEVGRGALAGPISAAACVVNPENQQNFFNRPSGIVIRDSKKTTKRQRQIAYEWLKEECATTYVAVNVHTINEIGIQQANLQALQLALMNAFEYVNTKKVIVFVDHFDITFQPPKGLEVQLVCQPKADATFLSTAGASICAKVQRDMEMATLGAEYPEYQWDRNAGYGTLGHRKALLKSGPTPHHRALFIRKILSSAKQP